MSQIHEIADAVKAALIANAAMQAIKPGYAVQRKYVALKDLKTLPVGAPEKAPLLMVVPSGDDMSILARELRLEEIKIDVGIYQRLDTATKPTEPTDPTAPAPNDEIDDLVAFARQVALQFKPSDSVVGAPWVRTRYAPIFDSPSLIEQRTFIAVVAFTFKQAV